MWENGKYLTPGIQKQFKQPDIFLSSETNINRDNLGPIYVPKKGDTFPIHEETNWRYLLPIIMMEGHTATLDNDEVKIIRARISNWKNELVQPATALSRAGDAEEALQLGKVLAHQPDGRLLRPPSDGVLLRAHRPNARPRVGGRRHPEHVPDPRDQLHADADLAPDVRRHGDRHHWHGGRVAAAAALHAEQAHHDHVRLVQRVPDGLLRRALVGRPLGGAAHPARHLDAL